MRVSPFAGLALATSAVAQQVSNCVSGGVCYSVNVPEVTSSSGTGDIFIQITGPTTLSWIGIGQGTSMRGANIFAIYANEAGNNVTLSPRLSVAEQQPTTSGSNSRVTLLAGSGIENSMMTANFRCSNCNTWSGGSMSFTDSASEWIWAYHRGSALSSNSLDATLREHSAYGTMSLNLRNAAGGSSANPFVASDGSTSAVDNNNGTSSDGTTDADANGSSSEPAISQSKKDAILMAHAVLLCAAFAGLYPLGAIMIRLLSFSGLVWVHAGWMTITYIIALAGMGLGVWFAVNFDYLDSAHAIIGMVVVSALVLQPFTGLFHHKLYKSKGGPNSATPLHVWWGRAAVTLGIINGGLGLQLNGNTGSGMIAYSVVAGVMWAAWMAAIVFRSVKKDTEDRKGSSSSSEMVNYPPSSQHQDGSGTKFQSSPETSRAV